MASCERFMDLISQSLDGPLALKDQQALQQHLEECPECRQLSQELSEIRSELHSWEEQEVPDGFAEGVMARIRTLEEKPKVIPIWRHPQFKIFGSIAACALICVGIWRMDLPQMRENAAMGTDAAASAATIADSASAPVEYALSSGEAEAAYEFRAADLQQSASSDAHADATAPASLAEPKDASPVEDASAAPSHSPAVHSEAASLPTEDALIQTAHDALGILPGTLLFMDVIPETAVVNGTWHTTTNGFTLLRMEETTDAVLLQTYADKALLTLTLGEGPTVLITWIS